jgi:hypothetical protein
MTVVPIGILFGGYHIIYHLGRLTNYLLIKIFDVKFALSLPLTGIFGLVVSLFSLFCLAVIIKVLWMLSGNVMDWYDRNLEQRRINRFSSFDSPVPNPPPGGEALRHQRERMIRNLLSPEGQARLREEEEEEEVDEDRAYRERIGIPGN